MEHFSSLVKKYVCGKTFDELGIGEKSRVKWKDCCPRLFLRSVFLFLSREEDGRTVLFSEWQDLLEITAYLLIRVFDLEAEIGPYSGKNRKGAALFLPEGTGKFVLEQTESDASRACGRCMELFVRGAFLSCGTVLEPEKGYHASFFVRESSAAEELCGVLSLFGIEAKKSPLSDGVSVYLKNSGLIEDLLSLIGAERFAMRLMDEKIKRSIRGDINRRQNFDSANLQKAVDGAQSVILAIRELEKKGVLETLPEPLQSAAKLRMSYPDVSLKELCERSEEELTKSGLNHRLQKLVRLAEQLKNEEGE